MVQSVRKQDDPADPELLACHTTENYRGRKYGPLETLPQLDGRRVQPWLSNRSFLTSPVSSLISLKPEKSSCLNTFPSTMMPVDGLWKGNALLRSLLRGWRGPFSFTPLEGSLLCSEARRRVLDAGLSPLFVNYFATSQLFLLRVCGLKWLSRPSAQCCDSTVYLRKAGHYRHRGN